MSGETPPPPAVRVAERPVSLSIDRLTLTGLPMSGADSRRLGAALEQELGRLARAAEWGRATSLAAPAAAPLTLVVTPGMSPGEVGRSLARAVFGAVGDAR